MLLWLDCFHRPCLFFFSKCILAVEDKERAAWPRIRELEEVVGMAPAFLSLLPLLLSVDSHFLLIDSIG